MQRNGKLTPLAAPERQRATRASRRCDQAVTLCINAESALHLLGFMRNTAHDFLVSRPRQRGDREKETETWTNYRNLRRSSRAF